MTQHFSNRRLAKANQHSSLRLELKDRSVTITLKRSDKARRYLLRLRGADGHIILTLPKRGSLAQAEDFAKRHTQWLQSRLDQLPKPVVFAPNSIIPLRGIAHLLVHRPQIRAGKSAWVEMAPPESEPRLMLCACGEQAHFSRRITDYLKKQARMDLNQAVAIHAAAIGKKPKSITLKDTRSRWGSCSSAGALNFSWRLILAPPFILNYLAAHEVAHLIHHNHSDAFWALTAQLAPEWQKAESWLKCFGVQLHRYG